ncbi:MAG: pyridoxal-dependent decarboxylase [Bacteroidota bacterium]|nr:pyridoxal-dependent decarboxylase [Bacteroidota bacterium]
MATKEETLDPSDWKKTEELGMQMVKDMMQYLSTVRDRKVWQEPPGEVKNFFNQAIPEDGYDEEKIYEDFKTKILPYPTGNIHPRFWGWVMGTGTPFAMLADMLASGMNINQGGGNHVGGLVENQLINWFKKLFGFPANASGLLVSGGSMANLTGLTVARYAKAGFDLRKKGIYGSDKRMMVYASTEVHNCVNKAVDLLGLGSDSLRLINVNDNYEIDIEELQEQILRDRESGLMPFCVVGNAVTVNTGACDDLVALADLCKKEDLWFHVDGAIGAMLSLSEKYKNKVAGIERADSLAFDMHKWLYIPYEAAGTLVRNNDLHYNAFSLPAAYLQHEQRGMGGGDTWFSDYGVELSRGFKALKIWMSLKEHGTKKFGRMITQNVEQVQYLKSLINKNLKLELTGPAPLNLLCFRYIGDLKNDEQLNELNKELLFRLHESGIALPSYTTLKGKYSIRVANTNHRTVKEDFEILVNKVVELGEELEKELLHLQN